MNSTNTETVRHGPYPELTTTAVLVGYFLGAVIAVSIGYAALILGVATASSKITSYRRWPVVLTAPPVG